MSDPDSDPVTLAVTSVQQDEGVQAAGSGNTCPDAVIDGGAASVRAERTGSGDGRVYVLGFTATDDAGASCEGEVRVCVPHSKSGDCVEGAVLVDSTSCP